MVTPVKVAALGLVVPMAGLFAKMYARLAGVSARAVALLLMSVVVAN